MPLGIISESEFMSELSNCLDKSSSISNVTPSLDIPSSNNSDSDSSLINPPINQAEVIDIKARGRGLGNVEVPEALRKVIGETSVIDGRSDAVGLANLLGIKPSSVSAYKEGAHSTATIARPNTDTKSHIQASKLRVSSRARRKLNLALSHITDDKLAEAKVGELASVAKSMSGIIKDMEPENDKSNENDNAPRYLIYAPQIKNENNYETIYAKE